MFRLLGSPNPLARFPDAAPSGVLPPEIAISSPTRAIDFRTAPAVGDAVWNNVTAPGISGSIARTGGLVAADLVPIDAKTSVRSGKNGGTAGNAFYTDGGGASPIFELSTLGVVSTMVVLAQVRTIEAGSVNRTGGADDDLWGQIAGWYGHTLTSDPRGPCFWRWTVGQVPTYGANLQPSSYVVLEVCIENFGPAITRVQTRMNGLDVSFADIPALVNATSLYFGRGWGANSYSDVNLAAIYAWRKRLTDSDRLSLYAWIQQEWPTTFGLVVPAVPAPQPVGLDLLSGGTFTRGSLATYQTDADSLEDALIGELRYQNLGDGLGPLLLLEGSRQNIVSQSQPASGWGTDAATITYAAADGPLGPLTAAQVAFTASATSRVRRTIGALPADGADLLNSCWVRGSVGGEVIRLGLQQKDGATVVVGPDIVLTTEWRRVFSIIDVGAGGTNPQYVLQNGSAGTAQTVFFTAAQTENGDLWPSSFIETVGAPLTRSADVLVYPSGQYPASFLTDGFRVVIVPSFSSAELGLGVARIVGFNASVNNYLALTAGGVEAIEGGVSRVLTAPLTWFPNQPIVIDVRPSLGTITISGAATGNGVYTGTAWSWPAGQLNVGNTNGSAATLAFFGGLVRYIESVPILTPTPPATQPQITGTFGAGNVLTVTPGTWT